MSRAMYAFQRRLRAVTELDGFRPTYLTVLLMLTTYSNKHGVSQPSMQVLVNATGLSRSTVRDALKWAGQRGLIRKIGGGYKGRASVYQLIAEPGQRCHPHDTNAAAKGATPTLTKSVTPVTPYISSQSESRSDHQNADPWNPDNQPEPAHVEEPW